MQRNDHKDFEFVTLSCRVFGRDARLVHRAAEAQQQSAADWMRRVILDHVAHELRIPSTYAPLERPGALIADAAKRRGITTKEFVQQAAREVAERERLGQEQERTARSAQGQERASDSLSIESQGSRYSTRVPQHPGKARPAQPIGQLRGANNESGTRRRQG